MPGDPWGFWSRVVQNPDALLGSRATDSLEMLYASYFIKLLVFTLLEEHKRHEFCRIEDRTASI